ncbi:MAG: two-component regulator propeller domain-containing protein [Nibricoccus sp.]
MPRPAFRLVRILFAATCLSVCFLRADYKAPGDYTLREWNEPNGLPSNETASVFQDENGYLWVATNSGLARFDGAAFEITQAPSEASSRGIVYSRKTDVDGIRGIIAPPNSIAGTEGTATARVDGFYAQLATGEFQFFQEPDLTGKPVRTVFVDPSGAIWLGCEDGTLLQRTAAQKKVFPPPAGGPQGKRVPVFATDSQGTLWVAAGFYLARFEEGQWIPVTYGSIDPQIRICSSRTGGPWLITRTALLRWSDGQFRELMKLPNLLGAHFVQTTLEDRHGNFWIGTRSQGLFRFSAGQLLRAPTSSEDITSLCEDSEEDLWVATNGGGLNRLRPKAHRLYDQTSGLKDNFSYTVTEDTGGNIWLANRDGGVARILSDGTIDLTSKRANWRSFSAMSIYAGIKGGVWITSGIGIFKTDQSDPDKLQRISALNNFKTIRSTFVARNGDYWFSVDPDRVARWRDGQLTVFGAAEGFDGREVRAISEDQAGNIWLGAADGRLFRSSGDRFELTPFVGSESVGAIQSLFFTADGALLVGTTRQGVMILSPDGRIAPRLLSSKNGLPNNNISQILSDDYDRYWFASRGGIFWLHHAQLQDFIQRKIEHVHAVPLGTDDGIPELSCLGLFQPAAWKSHDGKLWFATRRGVLCTDPSVTLTSDNDLPPVTASGVKCDGKIIPLDPEIEIPASARKTEIRMSVLCLSASERVVVRCRLDGFDNDWIIQKNSRVATYPKLPPGKYVFHAAASNGNGIWNEEVELLTLVVNPPWWKSVWAQTAYLLALVSVVGIIVRARSHRRLRRRLAKLEQERAVEQERTRIARNIHDELGASLTHISLLTQTAENEDPIQAARYEKIYAATRDITRAMDEVVWAVNPKCDDLENLVYYVSNFAQAFLGAANIRCRLDLPQKLPAIHLTSAVRHSMFLCCKEALNNIVKHSGADLVTIAITLSEQNDWLTLRLTDNGHGLESKSAQETSGDRIADGYGLNNMKSRMQEIGGSCEITSPGGEGTTVSFSLPIAPTS